MISGIRIITLFILLFCFSGYSSKKCCSGNKVKCCPCNPEKEDRKSLDNLVFQYTNPPVSTTKYCKKANKDLKTFKSYTKQCKDDGLNEMWNYFVTGYTEALKNRCAADAVEPKCDRQIEAYNGVEDCYQRYVNALYYINNNYAVNELLPLKCCLHPHREQCFYNKTEAACGADYANFLTNSIIEPLKPYSNKYCTGFKCEDYEEQNKKVQDVMDNSKPTKGQSLTDVVYRIHLKLLNIV